MSHAHQIENPEDIEQFILGGRATVTVVSVTTKTRFTYKVEQRKAKKQGLSTEQLLALKKELSEGPRFVKVMTGTDNENNFTYVGHINKDRCFRLDKSSKMTPQAPSVAAWMWFWNAVRARSEKLDQCEVWHNGRCSKCGRKLTVPESITRGLGPSCASK